MSQQEQKTEATTQVATPRVVSIISTRGERVNIPFEGNNWGELKKHLERGGNAVKADGTATTFSGYSLSNMKCVEGNTKHTLEHAEANLPEGSFNLFMMPYKSKSGALSRTDINTTIKGFIEKDGQLAKDFFTVNGKNYTQVASSTLEELIEQYRPGKAKKVSAAKATAIADVVDNVKASKSKSSSNSSVASADNDLFDEVSRMSTNEQMYLIIKLLTNINSKLGSGDSFQAEAQQEQPPVKTQEQIDEENRVAAEKEKEEAGRKQKEEEDKKKKEAEAKQREEDSKQLSSLASGFGDVRL